MKYKVEIEINRDRESFLEIFQDVDLFKHWQPGFQALNVIKGNPGEVGSQSKLVYLSNGKATVIDETIIRAELPDGIDFLYETRGVKNWARNQFLDLGDRTLWIADQEFKFPGLMKIMGFFPSLFINRTTKDMEALKRFAETYYRNERS
jgi:hypothetical protein